MRALLVLLLGLLPFTGPLDAAEIRYRVGLITTHPGAESLEQLAARRILQTLGIPYDLVPPAKLHPRYPLAILPGPVYNNSLSAADRETVYKFVSEGGVLMATQVEGTDYFPLLGVEGAEPRRDRFRLRFERDVEEGWLRYFDNPKEREISLGNPELFEETIWTVAYRLTTARKLAAFPDGSAAAVVNDYDLGQVLAVGASLTQTVLIAQVGKSFEAGREWVNTFEPSGDVMFLLVKGMYESAARPAVFWHTVPGGRETAIVITHDIDAQESFRNSLAFAQLAKRYGVFSTFFTTTKTFADAADIGYFDSTRIPFLATIRGMGFEIGSHTVSHSKRFAKFPMGVPAISLATYKPTASPTVIGEVKVSKELLDRNLPSQQTVSFRAGELAFPPRLIEALEVSGYRYDSTFSANNIITNFPFFAFERKALGARETRIVEIPVTVDDSRGYLTAESKDRVVRAWSGIIEANRANNAITTILIHPTDATYKLAVLQQLLERFTRENVWIGTIAGLGGFWSRRAGTGFRLEQGSAGGLLLRLDRSAAELGSDLAVVVSGQPGEIQIVDRAGVVVPARAMPRGDGRVFLLEPKR